jgi:cardiolipin synthase
MIVNTKKRFQFGKWAMRLLVVLIVVYLGIYTLLVTPRRFFQCLTAPIDFVNRYYGKALNATLPSFTENNKVELLVNGQEGMTAMLGLINSAQQTIRWQVMYFQPDEAGQQISTALAAAAKRGVKVQLMFDRSNSAEGSILSPYPAELRAVWVPEMLIMIQRMTEAGVQFLNNGMGLDYPLDKVSPEARAMQESLSGTACVTITHYDHRKFLVVDGKVAILGGMNVGNEYIYQIAPDLSKDMLAEAEERKTTDQPEAFPKWQDISVQVEGPAVSRMIQEFNMRWEVLGGTPIQVEPAPTGSGKLPVQVLFQRPGLVEISTAYMDLIKNAKTEIYIANPYVTYEPVVKALGDASKRGVKVIFMFPDKHNDAPTAARIFRAFQGDLVAAGVEVYNNNLRMVHEKIMVVDGKLSVVGAMNLDHLSFIHNSDNVVVIDDPAFAQELVERVFNPLIANSVRITDTQNTPMSIKDWLLQTYS